MENKDLGSKKINNEQELNEGFSGGNLPKGYNPAKANQLQSEAETDEHGNTKVVERARNADATDENSRRDENENPQENRPSLTHNEKTVENKDRNSDIANNRYPNSHPDNHEDRGNIKLDSE
jgi:hypothetical protein